MAGDPTGYDSVLAEIPKGQLSERQMRIAAGLSLIRDKGYSVLRAAKQVGIPDNTLWRYNRGLSTLETNQGVERNLEAVRSASFDVAQIAAERLTTNLLDPDHDWKDGDLVKAYGVATDKIAVLSQGRSGEASGVRDLVSALLEQGDVSITRRDPASDAVDVSPVGEREG